MSNNIKVFFKKNAPKIFFGLGIVSGGIGIYEASKGAIKAKELLDNSGIREQEYEKPVAKAVDILKITWKPFVPAALFLGSSLLCFIGSYNVQARKHAALSFAAGISESNFKDLKEAVEKHATNKVKEKIEESYDKKQEERAEKQGNTTVYINENYNPETDGVWFDRASGRKFTSNIDKINRIENKMNKELLEFDAVTINQLYSALGLEEVQFGDEIGWSVYDTREIGLGYSSRLSDDGEPMGVLYFKIRPTLLWRDYRDTIELIWKD